MNRVCVLGLSCLILLSAVTPPVCAGPEKWEETIKAFEEEDLQNPPPELPILFIGSSSIRKWSVQEWFPQLPVLNRGFGGSQFSDLNYYFDRIVLPYAPSYVVLYSGDNDLAVGLTPEETFAQYEAFVNKVHDAFPETVVIVIAIKPSIARLHLLNEVIETNDLIGEHCAADDRLIYVNIF